MSLVLKENFTFYLISLQAKIDIITSSFTAISDYYKLTVVDSDS